MFNKNDPLIGAVQGVMKKNAAEREAVKVANEKFGIQDRKALPREKQGEWDAAYKDILSEELKGNQHKIDANKNGKVDGQDFDLLKKGVRPVAEEGDPSMAIRGDGQTGGSSVSTVPAPKAKAITPSQQNALKNKIKSIMKEAAGASAGYFAYSQKKAEVAQNAKSQGAQASSAIQKMNTPTKVDTSTQTKGPNAAGGFSPAKPEAAKSAKAPKPTTKPVIVAKKKEAAPAPKAAAPVAKKMTAMQRQMKNSRSGRDAVAGPRGTTMEE